MLITLRGQRINEGRLPALRYTALLFYPAMSYSQMKENKSILIMNNS